MNKFTYKLMQFMSGRYGFDTMGRDLFVLSFLLIALDILIPGNIASLIATVMMVFAVYRMLSRNTAKRQAEQNWYMSHIGGRLYDFTQRDHEHYRYFRCPSCHQTLRAPKGKGRIRITCSRCGHVFEKKV